VSERHQRSQQAEAQRALSAENVEFNFQSREKVESTRLNAEEICEIPARTRVFNQLTSVPTRSPREFITPQGVHRISTTKSSTAVSPTIKSSTGEISQRPIVVAPSCSLSYVIIDDVDEDVDVGKLKLKQVNIL
jgi:hypothetical protein